MKRRQRCHRVCDYGSDSSVDLAKGRDIRPIQGTSYGAGFESLVHDSRGIAGVVEKSQGMTDFVKQNCGEVRRTGNAERRGPLLVGVKVDVAT